MYTHKSCFEESCNRKTNQEPKIQNKYNYITCILFSSFLFSCITRYLLSSSPSRSRPRELEFISNAKFDWLTDKTVQLNGVVDLELFRGYYGATTLGIVGHSWFVYFAMRYTYTYTVYTHTHIFANIHTHTLLYSTGSLLKYIHRYISNLHRHCSHVPTARPGRRNATARVCVVCRCHCRRNGNRDLPQTLPPFVAIYN